MKVFLVWERESYCEYDVINIFLEEDKATEYVNKKNREVGDDDRFRVETRTVGEEKIIKW